MGIRIRLNHKTTYNYDRPVTLSPQIVRLHPASHTRTRVTDYSLRVEPEEHFINWQQDPSGNFLARLVFPGQTTRLFLEVNLAAELTPVNPFDFFLEPYAERFPFRYEARYEHELKPLLQAAPLSPVLRDFLASIDGHGLRTTDFLADLNQRVQREIRYLIRREPGVHTPDETIKSGIG